MRAWKAVACLAILALPMAARAYPAHYFVVHESGDARLSIASHALVELRGTPGSGPPEGASVFQRRLRADVIDKASSRLLLEVSAPASPWLRGEFQGVGGIEGHVLALAEHDFVVRVPAYPGAKLRLAVVPDAWGGAPVASAPTPILEVDLDAYAQKATRASLASTSGTLVRNGDPANRLDLLIVAEGYTADQRDRFMADAGDIAAHFFSISPYSDFAHLANVEWLFVASNQSGADKPSCPETPGAPVTFVDTAFDATYCTNGIRRLVTVDVNKVLTAAAAAPDWDFILVAVNDTEYGGSGGPLSVTTMGPSAVDIVQHEFGHSFMRLADEYDTFTPGYPGCSDLPGTTLPCEPNVTDQTDRNLLKWRDWVDGGTPIPTSGPLADPIAAGLWLGARYDPSNMYRQCYNGLMRTLGEPLCHIEREAFVKRLYGGGWGTPMSGVSLIEPGSLPASDDSTVPQGSDVAFAASLAGSPGPGALSAAWIVDGATAGLQAAASGDTTRFTFRMPDTGSHTVVLEVTDHTPMLLSPAVRSRTWTVHGTAPGATTDLALAMTSEPDRPEAGKDIVYRLLVTNKGPVVAHDVRVIHPLPGDGTLVWASSACSNAGGTLTCATSSVDAGASVEYRLVLRLASPGMLTTSAVASATEGDSDGSDNSASLSIAVAPSPAASIVARYRLYNDGTKEHLYTTDLNEYQTLGANGWSQEGTVGRVLDNPGSFNGVTATPYYRLYNDQTFWHHWTTDPNEYYTLIQFGSWHGEGAREFILPTATTGATTLYRLLYPFVPGLHHWTIDQNEYDTLTTQYGWVGEGGTGFVIE